MRYILVVVALVILNYRSKSENIKGKKAKKNKEINPPVIKNRSMGNTWDSHTDRRIGTLHPKLQQEVTDLINTFYDTYGIKMRVTQALRTFEEQNNLYAIGRTVNGDRVTNAKGGQSYHNYGLAFDIVPIINGKAIWNNHKIFEDFAKIAKAKGWKWGGNFTTFKDRPHFEKTFGMHYSQLSTMYTDSNPYPNI